MKFLYFILHFFTDCPDEDIEWHIRNTSGKCKKCGRTYFRWN